PIKDRFDLEGLQIGFKRQDSSRDAGQVGCGPAGGRLLSERSQISSPMSLELDLIAQLIHELKRIVEKPFVNGDQRRREGGRITASQGMVVVSGGEDQYVFVI